MTSSTTNQRTADSSAEQAINAFATGKPVLVHDAADREGEIDIIYPAATVDASAVAQLRQDAGGLICTAVSASVAERMSLPFLHDELSHPAADAHQLEYDERSSFSLPVNHRDTYTGITDTDRAQTIRALAEAAADDEFDERDFAAEFRSPGHVTILRGAVGLLESRRGHTEFGLALADAAGQPPAVVVCEMLDGSTGTATSPKRAREYAETHDIEYIEGAVLTQRFS
jgi:3,4-dihydroxy 2-butanone 4-phosphate synthase